MKYIYITIKYIVLFACLAICIGDTQIFASVKEGDLVKLFTFKDINGRNVQSRNVFKSPMTAVFFFLPEKEKERIILKAIEFLAKKNQTLSVIAIPVSPREYWERSWKKDIEEFGTKDRLFMTLEYKNLAKIFDIEIITPILIWIDSEGRVIQEKSGNYVPDNFKPLIETYHTLEEKVRKKAQGYEDKRKAKQEVEKLRHNVGEMEASLGNISFKSPGYGRAEIERLDELVSEYEEHSGADGYRVELAQSYRDLLKTHKRLSGFLDEGDKAEKQGRFEQGEKLYEKALKEIQRMSAHKAPATFIDAANKHVQGRLASCREGMLLAQLEDLRSRASECGSVKACGDVQTDLKKLLQDQKELMDSSSAVRSKAESIEKAVAASRRRAQEESDVVYIARQMEGVLGKVSFQSPGYGSAEMDKLGGLVSKYGKYSGTRGYSSKTAKSCQDLIEAHKRLTDLLDAAERAENQGRFAQGEELYGKALGEIVQLSSHKELASFNEAAGEYVRGRLASCREGMLLAQLEDLGSRASECGSVTACGEVKTALDNLLLSRKAVVDSSSAVRSKAETIEKAVAASRRRAQEESDVVYIARQMEGVLGKVSFQSPGYGSAEMDKLGGLVSKYGKYSGTRGYSSKTAKSCQDLIEAHKRLTDLLDAAERAENQGRFAQGEELYGKALGEIVQLSSHKELASFNEAAGEYVRGRLASCREGMLLAQLEDLGSRASECGSVTACGDVQTDLEKLLQGQKELMDSSSAVRSKAKALREAVVVSKRRAQEESDVVYIARQMQGVLGKVSFKSSGYGSAEMEELGSLVSKYGKYSGTRGYSSKTAKSCQDLIEAHERLTDLLDAAEKAENQGRFAQGEELYERALREIKGLSAYKAPAAFIDAASEHVKGRLASCREGMLLAQLEDLGSRASKCGSVKACGELKTALEKLLKDQKELMDSSSAVRTKADAVERAVTASKRRAEREGELARIVREMEEMLGKVSFQSPGYGSAQMDKVRELFSEYVKYSGTRGYRAETIKSYQELLARYERLTSILNAADEAENEGRFEQGKELYEKALREIESLSGHEVPASFSDAARKHVMSRTASCREGILLGQLDDLAGKAAKCGGVKACEGIQTTLEKLLQGQKELVESSSAIRAKAEAIRAAAAVSKRKAQEEWELLRIAREMKESLDRISFKSPGYGGAETDKLGKLLSEYVRYSETRGYRSETAKSYREVLETHKRMASLLDEADKAGKQGRFEQGKELYEKAVEEMQGLSVHKEMATFNAGALAYVRDGIRSCREGILLGQLENLLRRASGCASVEFCERERVDLEWLLEEQKDLVETSSAIQSKAKAVRETVAASKRRALAEGELARTVREMEEMLGKVSFQSPGYGSDEMNKLAKLLLEYGKYSGTRGYSSKTAKSCQDLIEAHKRLTDLLDAAERAENQGRFAQGEELYEKALGEIEQLSSHKELASFNEAAGEYVRGRLASCREGMLLAQLEDLGSRASECGSVAACGEVKTALDNLLLSRKAVVDSSSAVRSKAEAVREAVAASRGRVEREGELARIVREMDELLGKVSFQSPGYGSAEMDKLGELVSKYGKYSGIRGYSSKTAKNYQDLTEAHKRLTGLLDAAEKAENQGRFEQGKELYEKALEEMRGLSVHKEMATFNDAAQRHVRSRMQSYSEGVLLGRLEDLAGGASKCGSVKACGDVQTDLEKLLKDQKELMDSSSAIRSKAEAVREAVAASRGRAEREGELARTVREMDELLGKVSFQSPGYGSAEMDKLGSLVSKYGKYSSTQGYQAETAKSYNDLIEGHKRLTELLDAAEKAENQGRFDQGEELYEKALMEVEGLSAYKAPATFIDAAQRHVRSRMQSCSEGVLLGRLEDLGSRASECGSVKACGELKTALEKLLQGQKELMDSSSAVRTKAEALERAVAASKRRALAEGELASIVREMDELFGKVSFQSPGYGSDEMNELGSLVSKYGKYSSTQGYKPETAKSYNDLIEAHKRLTGLLDAAEKAENQGRFEQGEELYEKALGEIEQLSSHKEIASFNEAAGEYVRGRLASCREGMLLAQLEDLAGDASRCRSVEACGAVHTALEKLLQGQKELVESSSAIRAKAEAIRAAAAVSKRKAQEEWELLRIAREMKESLDRISFKSPGYGGAETDELGKLISEYVRYSETRGYQSETVKSYRDLLEAHKRLTGLLDAANKAEKQGRFEQGKELYERALGEIEQLSACRELSSFNEAARAHVTSRMASCREGILLGKLEDLAGKGTSCESLEACGQVQATLEKLLQGKKDLLDCSPAIRAKAEAVREAVAVSRKRAQQEGDLLAFEPSPISMGKEPEPAAALKADDQRPAVKPAVDSNVKLVILPFDLPTEHDRHLKYFLKALSEILPGHADITAVASAYDFAGFHPALADTPNLNEKTRSSGVLNHIWSENDPRPDTEAMRSLGAAAGADAVISYAVRLSAENPYSPTIDSKICTALVNVHTGEAFVNEVSVSYYGDAEWNRKAEQLTRVSFADFLAARQRARSHHVSVSIGKKPEPAAAVKADDQRPAVKPAVDSNVKLVILPFDLPTEHDRLLNYFLKALSEILPGFVKITAVASAYDFAGFHPALVGTPILNEKTRSTGVWTHRWSENDPRPDTETMRSLGAAAGADAVISYAVRLTAENPYSPTIDSKIYTALVDLHTGKAFANEVSVSYYGDAEWNRKAEQLTRESLADLLAARQRAKSNH